MENVSMLEKAKCLIDKKEARKDWNIRDWEIKDPETLKDIKEYSPELYQKMYNSYYKNTKNLNNVK